MKERGIIFVGANTAPSRETIEAFERMAGMAERVQGSFATSSPDPKGHPPGHCSDCGIKLHSEASKARGHCAGCADRRKRIGPERPKG